MPDQPPFVEVQKCLSGMDYPATRDQLIEHARSKGADQAMLKMLSRIPDREYEGPSGVSQEISKVT